ncbi:hypothetical protein BDW66DRAFT_169610 [Aspergillus desertorum]
MQSERLKRRRNYINRSRTGCRTCRLRHVKCDETPVACRNCLSSGWKCEGRRRSIPSTPAVTFRRAITSDEKRCVSFFLHRTVESLTSFYDTFLWRKLVSQMCCTEPAVYHAVVPLSALMARFALEQCMRSFELLNKRQSHRTPQLHKVLLVCCLLFVMLELVLGHYDDATVHLQSGLAILKEMRIQRQTLGLSPATVEDSLLEAFLHLEAQATQHGVLDPALSIDDELLYGRRYEEYLNEFQSLQDVQRALGPLINTHVKYHRLAAKEQRGVDMLKLIYLTLNVTVKTCLYTGAVIDKFQDRPLMMIETGVCPPLFTIAAHCPDWSVRMRAIDALKSWHHCEGYMNPKLVANMVVEVMKLQLKQVWSEIQATGSSQPLICLSWSTRYGDIVCMLSLEPDEALINALSSIRTARKWPCVRASGFLP